VTRIREREYGSAAKVCDRILGVDANALYLWSMMQPMPTGYMVRRKEEDQFTPHLHERYGLKAFGWIEWLSFTKKEFIQHKFNLGEKRLGKHRLPVDGYSDETKTVYQFHGCVWHGHRCRKTTGILIHPKTHRPLDEHARDTTSKEDYLKHLGYNLSIIYECQWEDEVRLNPSIKVFLAGLYDKLLGNRGKSSKDKYKTTKSLGWWRLI